MSYFDDMLMAELEEKSIPFEVLSVRESKAHEERINKKIKFKGFFIDWGVLSRHKSIDLKNVAYEHLSEYLRSPNEVIYIVGDSLLDCSYKIDSRDLVSAISLTSEVPQHSYFFPESLSWILCVTSDGVVDVALVELDES